MRVTINGFTYRSSIAVMGGRYMVGVSADNRAGAGVKGGDEIDVDIELDNAPREVVVPPELAAALDADPAARRHVRRAVIFEPVVARPAGDEAPGPMRRGSGGSRSRLPRSRKAGRADHVNPRGR